MCSYTIPEAEELAAMTAAEVEALARRVDLARREAESAAALLLLRVEAAGVYRSDDHRGVKAWARAACNWSGPEAARMLKAAHLLDRFPSAAGMGVAQMNALAAVVANPRVQAYLDGAEELLVGQAAILDFEDYVTFLAYWVATVDPDGAHADHERAHRERQATMADVGNKTFLNAQGGAAQGAQMKEIYDAFINGEFLADWEAGVAEHGDGMNMSLMERTTRQRRFDALFAIFVAAAHARGQGVSEPTVNILVDQDTFEQSLERVLGGSPEPSDPNTGTHRCEAGNGTLLDPLDVLVAAAIGHVRRVVLDSAGVIVDIGRKQRLFTGALREVILALGRRCFWPGCHHPAGQSQVDHVLPYSNDGPTAAWNGAPACGRHNRWRTRGYLTWRDEHGQWRHQRPDGTEVGWRADQHTTAHVAS